MPAVYVAALSRVRAWFAAVLRWVHPFVHGLPRGRAWFAAALPERAPGRGVVLPGAHAFVRGLSRGREWPAAVRSGRALTRLLERGPVLGRRRVPDASPFMDYGPDWPPAPRPAPIRHPLLRRCAAAVVLYALIWAVGSVLLEVRLHQLRDPGGVPVTTYTTVSPHRGHH
ncbi:hypothetical protein [Actinomadura sp. DC4]|uniref:hypothetical protein n=1 Tax=Actinomadura sp. DC4 TaxID=3055069 RepID=UPI0025AF8074|nr:hypothetical protein [Actinomadura sp. DC4]MDN3353566.1 hypothetical protein [Actinomadura sp. DC4]